MKNKLTTRLPDYTQAPRNASSSRFSSLVFMFQKIDFTIVFLLKKYPKILDKPFLGLYLCSVNQPQNMARKKNVARHVPT